MMVVRSLANWQSGCSIMQIEIACRKLASLGDRPLDWRSFLCLLAAVGVYRSFWSRDIGAIPTLSPAGLLLLAVLLGVLGTALRRRAC
jgi:hypothetical protein